MTLTAKEAAKIALRVKKSFEECLCAISDSARQGALATEVKNIHPDVYKTINPILKQDGYITTYDAKAMSLAISWANAANWKGYLK